MLDFRVSFNSKDATYYPKDQVTATVYLENDREISAHKIGIEIKGIVKTSWEETRRIGKYHKEFIPFGSELHYINANATLWESMDGTNLLQPGKHQFPFKFTIPENAPPSIIGKLGSIRYYIQTNIPSLPDEIRIFPFYVCSVLDLSYDTTLKSSVQSIESSIQRFWFSCATYPLCVMVEIPLRGYIPGKIIDVSIDVLNKTTLFVKRFEIGILQTITYIGKSNYQTIMTKKVPNVVTTKNVEVDKRAKIFSLNDAFEVPQLIPSYHGPLISITYALFVHTFMNSVYSNGPSVLIPITIGSLPFRTLPLEATLTPVEILTTTKCSGEKEK